MRKILPWFLLFSSAHFIAYSQDGNHVLLEKADALILNSRFSEAMETLDRISEDSISITVDNKKAETLTRMGKFEDAAHLLRGLQIQLTGKPDDVLTGVTETNLGFLQLNQGRSDLAEETLQNALRRFASARMDNSQEAANTLSYLGLVFMSQGKYSQAQEQLHRTLALRRQAIKNKDALIAATYNDLGLAYSQTDKDKALDYYEQAHKMYRYLYEDDDPRIAIANINIGIIHRELKLYEDAINNFETALQISAAVYAQPHPAKAIALYNLGQTYLQLNDQKSARGFYQKALRMYEDCYGVRHPEIASVLNAMGNLYLSESDFDESLKCYQRALHANVLDFSDDNPEINPPLKNYYNGTRLLHSLLFKAQAYEARYVRKSLKFSDLKEALYVLTLCDSLIDQLRQHSTNESDKLQLGVMANEVYADGVRVAYQAGLNALRKEPYFEKAFYFAEKSKGAVLLESISDANAKSFAGIPRELLEEERKLKSALTLFAQKLAQKPGAEEEKLLRGKSFDIKIRYETFVKRLEHDFPEYFNLKFNAEMPSIRQLQTLLNDQTALVSYFIDDKNNQLYIFLIRNKHFKLWQRPLTNDFDKYITGLRNGLYFQEINTYKMSAYHLAQTLLPPMPSSVTDLVILPSGRLGLIPFETLLTGNADKITLHSALPYLINRYSIHYEFSAGLLLQRSRKSGKAPSASIFLCAPVNFPQRSSLGELPGTEREVSEISKLFSGRNLTAAAYTRVQADEKLIKTGRLKDFGFLHFATHGVVDELNPELSRIFLQPGADNDGDLFAGEIYSLELNANLVTLSACQTGLGQLVQGEGVIGLSRALVYAGAKNIVVSYWNVMDESTADLMTDFYKRILEDPDAGYSQSLREAKLQLLKDERFSAPYYWAPFVLIGF